MIPVQCSNCGAKMGAPESAIGKKAKCNECGHKFVIQQPGRSAAAPVATAPHEDDVPEFADSVSYGLQEPEPPSPANFDDADFFGEPPARTSRSVQTQAQARAASRPLVLDSAKKYLQLDWYLRAVAAVANIVLTLLVLIGGLLMLLGFGILFGAPIGPAECIALEMTGLSVILTGVGYWVVTRASVQFVRVIMDIEANTRTLIHEFQTASTPAD